MQIRTFFLGIAALLITACVSEQPSDGRSESVMMDGYDVCRDAEGGAGELVQKINNKFAVSVKELARTTDGPAFAARLSEKTLQEQNAILDVVETSANKCISSPVSPELLQSVRKSRDEAQASFDGWMATAPELFKDAPRGPTDADIANFINILAEAANSYAQAQAAAAGSYQQSAGNTGPSGSSGVRCVDREVVNTNLPYCN